MQAASQVNSFFLKKISSIFCGNLILAGYPPQQRAPDPNVGPGHLPLRDGRGVQGFGQGSHTQRIQVHNTSSWEFVVCERI